MRRQRLLWTYVLIAGGLLLMFPALYTSGISGASADDWDAATSPVARLPLDSLRDARFASLVFTVPVTDQWVRIRDLWGDSGYIVVGRTDDRSQSVLSWSSLGLEVTGSTARGPLDMTAASSRDVHDSGVTFRPTPGERVRLNVRAKTPGAPPNGELVVQVNWGSDPKFLLGRALFSLDFRPHLRLGLLCGVILLVAAAVLGNWRTA